MTRIMKNLKNKRNRVRFAVASISSVSQGRGLKHYILAGLVLNALIVNAKCGGFQKTRAQHRHLMKLLLNA